MKEILLFGAYSYNNLGDDLILLVVNRLLKRKEIMPLVFNRYGMNDFFTNDYNFVDNAIYDVKLNNKKLKRIIKIQSEKVKSVDALFFIGGGYSNEKFGIMNLIKMYLIIKKYSKANVPIYFFGQTIGPATSYIGCKMLEKIYSKGKKVYVRERYSMEYFCDMINTELVGDDVYLAYEDFEKCNNKKENIIVNIKDFEDNYEYYNEYFNLLCNISRESNNEIHIIPFRNDEKEIEYKLNYKLYQDLKKQNINCKFIIIETYENLINEFSRAIAVIGSAYHSVVLGLIAGANVYGIYNGNYYERKIKGVLNLYDLGEKNTIPFKNLAKDAKKFKDGFITMGLKENPEISSTSKTIYEKVLHTYTTIIEDIKEGNN